ncbi:MAG: hypothetical protein JXQ99_20060 [Hyphomicrobiaceae bacterium]
MLRSACLAVLVSAMLISDVSAQTSPVRCQVLKVDGNGMVPVQGKRRYFQSRPPGCPAGTHATGGGFRREFSQEKVQRNWRFDASFPISTNGLMESWACWAKYIGSKPIPAKPPSTLWCYAVCCPD